MPKRDGTDLARALASKAAADEAVVEKLADDPEVPDDVIGFHAQQAVEKRIKSVLAAGGVEFERTHNLAYLIALLADSALEPPPEADALPALTPWATEFRYEPASGASLDRTRVRELVRAVRRWAKT